MNVLFRTYLAPRLCKGSRSLLSFHRLVLFSIARHPATCASARHRLREGLADLIVPVTTLREGVDFLAMGRTEGRSCYCSVNHALQAALDAIIGEYGLVVMDTEARMEHVCRRTSDRVDHLFVLAQPTMASVGVARRFLEMADDVELEVGKAHLVLDNVRSDESWEQLVGQGVPVEGMLFRVPHDESLREAGVTGECVGFAGPAAEALEAALKNALGP